MKKTNKLAKVVAGFALLSLVAAACGGSDDSGSATSDGGDYTSLDACATRTFDYTAPETASAGMKITYDIAPEAVCSLSHVVVSAGSFFSENYYLKI